MKFLVTEECGRLARWVRLMGYDTVWATGVPLGELYRRAYNERRIIVTRNCKVGVSRLVRVIHLASGALDEQLRQLMQDVPLRLDEDRLFSRCDRCNIEVQPIEKTQVNDRVPPYVYQTQERFYTCPSCQRVYWAATHYQRAHRLFEKLRG